MAEEEPKPLTFIPEIILKKRKSNEEWAIKRKQQLEGKRQLGMKERMLRIKRPEEFVKLHREQELDLIRMKQRTKRPSSALERPKSKLLFVVRIQGKSDVHPKTKKVLYNLRLRRVFSGVFVKANETVMQKLQRVEPYVTYGYPNLKTVRDLIQKKGFANVDKKAIPLTDNNLIEQELGQYGILCLEDIVHEIANVGPHFKEVTRFLWPFMLNKPKVGLQRKKSLFKDGGDTGNREDKINELISKMN